MKSMAQVLASDLRPQLLVNRAAAFFNGVAEIRKK